jgi:two-component system, chemotaxis family, chemotaxis protein CheY
MNRHNVIPRHVVQRPQPEKNMTLSILTVDDSQTMRDVLRLALVSAGMRVEQAKDGMQGLEVLTSFSPNVIVTDLNMPRMDGLQFIAAVRGRECCSDIPILVLSTEIDADLKMRASTAGATGWIAKPFEPAALVAAIHRLAA